MLRVILDTILCHFKLLRESTVRGTKGLATLSRTCVGIFSRMANGEMCKISILEVHPGVPVEDPSWLVGFKRSLWQVVLVLRGVICTDQPSLALGAKIYLHVFVLHSPAGLLIWP